MVVVALEHADGSASVAQLAGPGLAWEPWERETAEQVRGRWRWYRGLGGREMYRSRTVWRVRELQTALRLLEQLNDGCADERMWVSGGAASRLFKGRLDMDGVLVSGHSYGGATAALAVASDPRLKGAVLFDPWWCVALPATPAWEAGFPCLPWCRGG